ncbi:MAG: Clp protease N-terminal domain-containing protein [Acidimicrobiia bacterium]
MFERFTEASRRAIVFAQDEARLLEHPSIGTAHVLLGLIHEAEGIGGRALISLGLSLVETRAVVVESSDELLAAAPSPDPIPFAADAKELLELAPREALRLGHRNIGTEHLVLALTDQPDSLADRVLEHFEVDRPTLRGRVLELLAQPASPRGVGRAARSTQPVQLSPETQELLARSARKAMQLGVAYASKRSLPLRLLGSAGNAALGTAPDRTGSAAMPAIAAPTAAVGLTPARCSFCGTPSPACGTLFSGATGALICERCVDAAAPPP